MRRRIVWGVAGYLVTTLGTLVTSYLSSKQISPLLGSILATAVGLSVVIVGVLIDYAKDRDGNSPPRVQLGKVGNYPVSHAGVPPHPSGQVYGRPVTPPRSRGAGSVLGVILLVVLLCGGGGWTIAYGIQWLGDKGISLLKDQIAPPWERKTRDSGVERIDGTASHAEGPLSVSVTSVRVNDEVTIVTLTAKNAGNETLSLPTFGYAQLTVPGSNTLTPDPAASAWAEAVPPGGETTGSIVFNGVLGPDVTGITLTFTHVFSLNGPKSIAVNIPITGTG